jgi:hypothetical protein
MVNPEEEHDVINGDDADVTGEDEDDKPRVSSSVSRE